MDYITFNMAGMHRHGSAFYEFLKLRKTFFVDQLGWHIPHDDEVEMDQYDNPLAWYSLVLDDEGEVVGGARALPTSARWGEHSFMLRDAAAGKLDKIPTSIMDGVELGPKVWESTRIVMSDKLQTAAERSECLQLMTAGISEIALRHGATEVVGLSLLPMVRAWRSLGYPVERRGRPYLCEDDGRQYAVLAMPLRPAKPLGHGAVPTGMPPTVHRTQPQVVHAPQRD
jgi:N-acyl-L-homoserine lactone synthetase